MSDPTSLPTGAPLTGAPVGLDLSELLRASARGDQAAFAQLYDATASRVHGLALRVVRDPAQAEEVTQEAYLEIWRTAARFDPSRGSALSWLLTLTHRKAVDRVRSAEAASRRDTTYHHQNQPVDVGSEGRSPASPPSSARPSSWRTSGVTPTPRSPPCSSFPSGPRRHASATDSSDSETPWG